MNYNKKPRIPDLSLLILFLVFITWQPYVLHHEIITMDAGIHLPSINALFHGMVPYRDFLFYRGPFELYVPTLMMLFFGKNMIWLTIFFYAGTILTMMVGLMLGYQIFRTRLILYLFAIVFIARTFPRVSYYYWGGLRYFIGLLAVFLAIECFKRKRLSWMLAAGVVSALSLLTTVEAGVATMGAIVPALVLTFILKIFDRKFVLDSLKIYLIGNLAVFLPYLIYLIATKSLFPFLEAMYFIPTKIMSTLLDARGTAPESFWQFILALFPGSPYFKVMTPVYCYLALFVYLVHRLRNKKLNWELYSLLTMAIYGIILYAAAFRKIEGHHFDMALQPEKVLLFFMAEEVYLFLLSKRLAWKANIDTLAVKGMTRIRKMGKVYTVNMLVFALIASSLSYSIGRYHHRFVVWKWLKSKVTHDDKDYSLLAGQETKMLTLERAKGMVVPLWQAEEIEGIVKFIEENTKPSDILFTYPELGNFNFWCDRPFVGRFPIVTFSWVDEKWHGELVSDFIKAKPKYVLMTSLRHRTFPAALYFRYPKNVRMHKEMTQLIFENYKPAKSFTSITIYKRK